MLHLNTALELQYVWSLITSNSAFDNLLSENTTSLKKGLLFATFTTGLLQSICQMWHHLVAFSKRPQTKPLQPIDCLAPPLACDVKVQASRQVPFSRAQQANLTTYSSHYTFSAPCKIELRIFLRRLYYDSTTELNARATVNCEAARSDHYTIASVHRFTILTTVFSEVTIAMYFFLVAEIVFKISWSVWKHCVNI